MSETRRGTRRLHLLIVEDGPGDFRLLQLAMEKNGFNAELHGVSDALAAMQFLHRQGEAYRHAPRPDLILLDLRLPEQDGLAFLTLLKNEPAWHAIPVVIISASEHETDVSAAYQCGAAGYVVKPVDLNEFVLAIHRLGQYWFNLVRLPERID